MQVLLEAEEAAVSQVRRSIPNPPSYDAVRTTLRILEEKGFVRHRQEGRRYLYFPTLDTQRAREAAVTHLVRTFFSGSPERAALALLRRTDLEIAGEELERIELRLRELEEGGDD
jgi:predicted transcriptional regulator